ncbi:MAG: Gfo/Idh/MocA family oxidoreductase [Chloroflexota bacterium]|nr:Gfo/Idh/MocA family oxidoreductase [Dehalococcoidia bacterium]MDW8254233.1 Gfo/Idh/MocA family oxidoreductase [Chloroflexota bacterium]
MPPISTLALTAPSADSDALSLALRRFHPQLVLRQASLADGLPSLTGTGVVVALLTGTPLAPAERAALLDFVASGGGLVVLGDRGALLGISEAPVTPQCELIVSVEGTHPISDRLDQRLTIVDASALLPDHVDGEVILRFSWHYRRLPLAIVTRLGRGRLVTFALEGRPPALTDRIVQRLLYRAVRFAAGEAASRTIGAALIGWGAIGSIHAQALQETPGLRLIAVCDTNPQRLEEARRDVPSARTYAQLEAVLGDSEVELAVVSTPPNSHAPIAARFLEAGKHVVVEKPFCLTTAEADRLIDLADRRQRTLTVYQNRRWDADFLAIHQAITSGTIGELFHIETFIGGFRHPCDFWHSHEPISGGLFYDWGAHYLDWILTLVPAPVRSVSASSQKRVWHDVTNADMARILLRFDGGVEAEFIHADIAAAPKPKWYILGTKGAVVASWRNERVVSRAPTGELIEQFFQPADAPATVVVSRRDRGGAIHHEHLELPSPPRWPFHRNLADHLLDSEPLAVLPQQARRTIAVMEAAMWSAAHDATPVAIDDRAI